MIVNTSAPPRQRIIELIPPASMGIVAPTVFPRYAIWRQSSPEHPPSVFFSTSTDVAPIIADEPQAYLRPPQTDPHLDRTYFFTA
jgi:hypothetical protein